MKKIRCVVCFLKVRTPSVFRLVCLSTGGGGGGTSWPLVPGHFPGFWSHVFSRGYPSPVTDPAWGGGGGYRNLGQGIPPARTGGTSCSQDRGTPLHWLCGAGAMPPTFTQEDFLVLHFFLKCGQRHLKWYEKYMNDKKVKKPGNTELKIRTQRVLNSYFPSKSHFFQPDLWSFLILLYFWTVPY